MAASRSEAEIREATVQCLGFCGWESDLEPNLAKCLEVLRKAGWEEADLEKVAAKVRSLCRGPSPDDPQP